MAVAANPTLPFYNEPFNVPALSGNPNLIMNDAGSLSLGTTLTVGSQSIFYGDSSNFASPWDLYNSTPSIFSLSNPSIQSPMSFTESSVYSTEESDLPFMNTDSEFLQQINGCSPITMHPNLVSTLKNMVAPGPGSAPQDSSTYIPQPLLDQLPANEQLEHHQQDRQDHTDSLGSAFLRHCEQSVEAKVKLQDGASLEVTVAAEPPNALATNEPVKDCLKTVEKSETDDNVEAAVVSVDLIQNRRPFRCQHDGCNKTFKNPQTMKMHHKTHYSDGSATNTTGLMALPTLTSSLKAGHNKKIPSRCPKCKKTFVGLYELRRHYGRKHSEGEKPFGCRKCGKKFYIEVDVRDHEKLCGEPIECKCGLKFAFKCNLVAHKKAHPACQDQNSNSNPANSNNQSSSSEDSEQSLGSSRMVGAGSKRARADNTSSMPSTLHLPIPDFKGIPEAPDFKMARHGFSGLSSLPEGNPLWASNFHYPSVTFTNLPMSSLYPNLGGFQGEHCPTKAHQIPSYEAVNCGMGITYNLPFKTWSG